MALSLSLQLIRFPPQALSSSSHHLLISDLRSISRFFQSPCLSSLAPSWNFTLKLSSRTKGFSMSTEEEQWSESETLVSNVDQGGDFEDEIDIGVQEDSSVVIAASTQRSFSSSLSDCLSLAIREWVYEED